MPTPSVKRPASVGADSSSQSSGRTESGGGGGGGGGGTAAAGAAYRPPRTSPNKQRRLLAAGTGDAVSFPEAAPAAPAAVEEQQQVGAPPAVATETITAVTAAPAAPALLPPSPERRLSPRRTAASAAAAVVLPPPPPPLPGVAVAPAPAPPQPLLRPRNPRASQSLVHLPPAPISFADPNDPTGQTFIVPRPDEARRRFRMRLGPGDAEALSALAAAVEATAPRRRPFVTRALATPLAMGICPAAVWGAARPALALFSPERTETKIASDDTKVAFLALFALSSGFADVTAGAIAAAQRDDPDLLRIRKGDLSIFLPSICAPGPVAAAAYRAASLAAAVAVASGSGGGGGGGGGGGSGAGSSSRNAVASSAAAAAAAAAATLSPRRSAAAAAAAAASASASASGAPVASSSPAAAAAAAAALAFAGTPLVLSRDTGVKFNGTQPERYVHWLFSAAMGVLPGVTDPSPFGGGGSPSSPLSRRGGAAGAAGAPASPSAAAATRQLQQQQQQQQKRVAAAAAAAAALTQAGGANAYLLPPHLLPPPALPSPDGGAPRVLHAALDLLSGAPHERAVVEAIVSYMHTVLLRHWEKHNNRGGRGLADAAPGSSSPPSNNAVATATAENPCWGSRAAAAAAAASGYPLLGGAPAAPRSVFFDGADAATGLTMVLPGPSTTLCGGAPSSSEEEDEGGGASPSRRSQRRAAAAAGGTSASASPPSSSPPQQPQAPLYPPHLSLLALAVAPNARSLADHLDSNRKQGALFFAAAANGPAGASAKETEARAVALGLPALAAKNVRRNAREQGEAPGGFLRVALAGVGGRGGAGRELSVICRILEGAEEVPAARAALEARLQIAAARRRAATG